jgi:hypothetical protein
VATGLLKAYTLPMPTTLPAKPETTEMKLDRILFHLERMDKRDRLRTIGGFIRTLIAVIPIVLLLWSAWYFVDHGADLMKMVADQAAKSAAQYTKTQSNGMLDQLMKQYGAPKK